MGIEGDVTEVIDLAEENDKIQYDIVLQEHTGKLWSSEESFLDEFNLPITSLPSYYMLTQNRHGIEDFAIDSSDVDDIWSPLLYDIHNPEPLPAQILTPSSLVFIVV